MRRALQHLLLAVLPLALLLLVLEGLVRWSGAGEDCPGSSGGLWKCHPILQFELDPDALELRLPLNAYGLRGRVFSDEPGVHRILALGDSCTFGIQSFAAMDAYPAPYPLRLERLVRRRSPGSRLEVLDAGVPGYNSWHGVMLLRTKLRKLRPDLVTVRFGWNDHFLSQRGAMRFREPESRAVLWLEDLALRFELYSFVRRLGLELRAWQRPSEAGAVPAETEEWRPSVPLDVYERNLRRMVEIGRGRGADVWLLTAPHNPATTEAARAHMARANRLPYERLIELHEQYNEATRRVGREVGARVLDMQAAYAAHRGRSLFHPDDPVHPNARGHALEAEILYDALVEQGVVTPPASGPSPRLPATRGRGRGA